MTERLDAYVLEFPKGSAPVFVRYPVHRAESEAGGGTGSGPEALPGPRTVLANKGARTEKLLEHDGRWRRRRDRTAQQELGL